MIKAYATNKDGDGYVQVIGEYESVEEIELRVGMFTNDVVISFETVDDEL